MINLMAVGICHLKNSKKCWGCGHEEQFSKNGHKMGFGVGQQPCGGSNWADICSQYVIGKNIIWRWEHY
jgi:hypothetical protein